MKKAKPEKTIQTKTESEILESIFGGKTPAEAARDEFIFAAKRKLTNGKPESIDSFLFLAKVVCEITEQFDFEHFKFENLRARAGIEYPALKELYELWAQILVKRNLLSEVSGLEIPQYSTNVALRLSSK